MLRNLRRGVLACLCAWAGPVHAQGLSFTEFQVGAPPTGSPPLISGSVNPGQDYFTLTRLPDRNNSSAATGFGYVSVSDLVLALSPGSSGTANGLALATIAARIDRMSDRFREGIALAGAINVLPPNPGDRFAVSFGGSGYDGIGVGSVAVSARVNEGTLLYLGYARGPTQNLVKGGVGFSFR